MSSSLLWEPADRKKKSLSDAMKYTLRKLYDEPVDAVLSESNIQELRGVIAGTTEQQVIRDAEELIEGIKKYGQIIVKEEY